MLPDFRVVAIAVVSTFLFAVSVGFYTSSRLASERKPRAETLAAIEENPLNRIALNWPEPVQPAQNALDLDFAVAARGRNPVRDVTDEIAAMPAPEPKIAAAPEAPAVAAPVVEPAAPQIEASKVEASKVEAPQIEAAKPESVPADPPPVEAMPAPVAAPVKQEDDIPTASIAAPPVAAESITPPASSASPVDAVPAEAKAVPEAPVEQVASRPEPGAPEVHSATEEKPAAAAEAKPAKKAAKKKPAKKRARRIVRTQPRVATSPAPSSSFSLFGSRR